MPGATATGVLASSGRVNRIVVLLGGVYESTPLLNIIGGGGSGAAITASLDLSQNFVQRVHVVASGQRYTSPPTISFVYQDGSVPPDLAATSTLLSSGSVVAVNITAPGTGYTGAAIGFSGGAGSGAAANAVLSLLGKVVSVNVLTPGLFKTVPGVTFVGGNGSGAVATAVLAATGSVVELNLTTPGVYTVAPTVVFTGTNVTLATALYHIGDDEWPTLPGFHTDEVTGIVINTFYKVVPKGTPYPGRSGYRGPFIEMSKYDKWKSIQMVSSVDLNTLPIPEAWPTTKAFHLPPILLALQIIWSDVVSKEVNALAASGGLAGGRVGSGSSGGLIPIAKGGFHGYANAIIARDYLYGSPPQSLIPAPLKILGSSGSAIIANTNSDTSHTEYDDGGLSFGDSFSNQVHAVDISEHLVPSFLPIIGETSHQSRAQNIIAVSPGGNTVAIAAFGTFSRVSINLPASTPAAEQLSSGAMILVDVEPAEWRFGIWVVERIYVIIP